MINAQWTQQILSSTDHFYNVYFTDANSGYITGYNSDGGIIYKTINGGNTWIKQFTDSSGMWLKGIYFKDINNGYVTGSWGSVFKTNNGGTDWIDQPSGWGQYFSSIQFTSANTAYVVGGSHSGGGEMVIFQTTNDCNSWTKQFSYPNSFWGGLRDIYFVDANTGFAVGDSGYVIKTSDGGINWTSQNLGTACGLTSIFFTDVNNGYIVGGSFNPHNSIILKTTDAGANWTSQTSGTTNTLRSVFFTDVNTGYAVGDSGVIIKTINGGVNWLSQSSGTLNELASVFFNDPNNGYIVGKNGIVLKTINGGNWINESSILSSVINIYPNPANKKLIIDIEEKAILEIINVQGQIVDTKSLTEKINNLDISKLSSGVYTLRIKTDRGIAIRKLIKQ
jgi:photosystem II stability/assembly factor-like uncharacterized protein